MAGENLGSVGTGRVDIKVAMEAFDRSMRDIANRIGRLTSQVVSIPVRFAGLGALTGIGATLKDAIDTSTRFETLMISLRKATDLTDDGFKVLETQLNGLATSIKGVSVEDLIRIATTGAKMGIAAPDLREYAEGIAKVASAMDDIPADRIADEIGKLNVIFNLGVKGTMQLGSAIDKLADSGVSSASGILNVTQRISGTATAAKITAQEAMALGAALLDTGSHAELASTSITHLLMQLNDPKAAKGFAHVLGGSAEEFAARVKKGPMEAIHAFLKEIAKLDAASQVAAFEGIGVKGDQSISELQKLAQAADNVQKYVGLANNEFQTLNQINQSYALSAGTTAAATENMNNKFKLLKKRIGDDLKPAYAALQVGLTAALGTVEDALYSVEIGASAVMERLGQFPAFVAKAVGPDVVGMVSAFADSFVAYLGEAIAFAGKLIRNFPDYVDVAMLQATQAFINLGEWINVIPANLSQVGNYIANNWRKLVTDAVVAVGTAFYNLGSNIGNLVAAIAKFMANPTEGFHFDWTDLLEGFKATADKLPDVIKPKLTSLQEEIDAALAKIDAKEAARKKAADELKAKADAASQGAKEAVKEEKAEDKHLDAEDKKKKAKDKEGKFSDILEYAKNLQLSVKKKGDAAANAARAGAGIPRPPAPKAPAPPADDPVSKLARETLEQAKWLARLVAESRTQTDVLKALLKRGLKTGLGAPQ